MPNSEKLVIDTASGVNVTNKKKWLMNYSKLNNPPTYYGMGQGNTAISILGVGFLPIKFNDNKIMPLETYYAPDEDATVISANKLWNELKISLNRGYKKLCSNQLSIKTEKINNTVWINADDLISYQKLGECEVENNKVIRAIRPHNPLVYKPHINLQEAHLRLNHIPGSVIQNTISNGIFEDVSSLKEKSITNFECETCTVSKITRHFHYTNSMNHYTRTKTPGSSWSADMFGPIQNLPVNSDKYMLIMVDNVSRYVMVTTHRQKDQDTISEQILRNIKEVKTQFGRTIQEIIMDRGSEFTNSKLKGILEKYGIKPIYTSTQDHSANARAERNIRTIVTDARTLLSQSSLPNKFWAYAVKAAANVRNCTYNKNIEDAPTKLISKYDIKITLRSFLPFGSPATIWTHNNRKIRAPGKAAITLCKDDQGFGYFFYVPKLKSVVSTTNYVLPHFTIQPDKNKKETLVGIFEKNIHKNIGDINQVKETEFDPDIDLLEGTQFAQSAVEEEEQSEVEESDQEDLELFEDKDMQLMKAGETPTDNLDVNDSSKNIQEQPKQQVNDMVQELFEDKAVQDTTNVQKIEDAQEEQQTQDISAVQADEDSFENQEIAEVQADEDSFKDQEIADVQADEDAFKGQEVAEVRADEDPFEDQEIQKDQDDLEDLEEQTHQEPHEEQVDKEVPAGQEDQTAQLDQNDEVSRRDHEGKISHEYQEEQQDTPQNDHKSNLIDELTPDQVDLMDEEQLTNIFVDDNKNSSDLSNDTEEKKHVEELEASFKQIINDELEREDKSTSDSTKKTGKSLREPKKASKFNLKSYQRRRQQNEERRKREMKRPQEEVEKDLQTLSQNTDRGGGWYRLPNKVYDSLRNPLRNKHRVNNPSVAANNDATPIVNITHGSNGEIKKQRIRFINPKPNWEKENTNTVRAIYFNEAITNNKNIEEKRLFELAYEKELNNLIDMKVFDPSIQLPRESIKQNRIIPINPIFNIKRDGTHKARIVCRGDLQDETSYSNIETSVLDMDSLKILIIIANNRSLRLRTFDINHAFLYADLEEELYINHPKKKNYVTPLNKALYGLKQSPRQWNNTLKEHMNKLGLYDSMYNPGFYSSLDGKVMIAAYVDDCIIAAETEEEIDRLIGKIEDAFSLKEVGKMNDDILKTDILGLDLHYDFKKGTVDLSLENYIKGLKNMYPHILKEKYKEANVPHVYDYNINPKTDTLDLSPDKLKERIKYLQVLIGRLNYIRTRGRIDIEFSVSKLARLVLFPHDKVLNAAHKLLRYTHATSHLGTVFKRQRENSQDITMISDASLGSEYDLKSRGGAIIWMGENLFHAFSRKSSILCESSAECELDAMNMAYKVGMILNLKLEQIDSIKKNITKLITDSQPAMDWLNQDYVKPRTKFIGLRVTKLKEKIHEKEIEIVKISGEHNPADPLTKPVNEKSFKILQDIMMGKISPKTILPLCKIESY